MSAMGSGKVFHVLACVDLSAEAGRRKLNGIYRFLSGGYAWDLSLIRSQKEFDERFETLAAETAFDGFLIGVPESARLRSLHRTLRIPTAFIDYVDGRFLRLFRACVFIHDDDRDIGRRAAHHLVSQGSAVGYGYAASCDDRPWNKRRGDAFVAALAKRNIVASRLPDTDALPLEAVADWIMSLPKPAAILAAYDDTARRVLEACRAAGLRVPTDVSVLGIGNDDLVCPYTSPTLSSVIPDFEEEGCRAARELQALMLRHRPPVQREILCGCSGIARRGSTVGEDSSALLVQQALTFIKDNAFKGITAADVVRHLRVSRRLADLRFREVTGTSILAYLTDLRLKRVKHLLATTDLRIGEIARQCGYEPANLKNLFARHAACSMRAWRLRHRA